MDPPWIGGPVEVRLDVGGEGISRHSRASRLGGRSAASPPSAASSAQSACTCRLSAIRSGGCPRSSFWTSRFPVAFSFWTAQLLLHFVPRQHPLGVLILPHARDRVGRCRPRQASCAVARFSGRRVSSQPLNNNVPIPIATFMTASLCSTGVFSTQPPNNNRADSNCRIHDIHPLRFIGTCGQENSKPPPAIQAIFH